MCAIVSGGSSPGSASARLPIHDTPMAAAMTAAMKTAAPKAKRVLTPMPFVSLPAKVNKPDAARLGLLQGRPQAGEIMCALITKSSWLTEMTRTLASGVAPHVSVLP